MRDSAYLDEFTVELYSSAGIFALVVALSLAITLRLARRRLAVASYRRHQGELPSDDEAVAVFAVLITRPMIAAILAGGISYALATFALLNSRIELYGSFSEAVGYVASYAAVLVGGGAILGAVLKSRPSNDATSTPRYFPRWWFWIGAIAIVMSAAPSIVLAIISPLSARALDVGPEWLANSEFNCVLALAAVPLLTIALLIAALMQRPRLENDGPSSAAWVAVAQRWWASVLLGSVLMLNALPVSHAVSSISSLLIPPPETIFFFPADGWSTLFFTSVTVPYLVFYGGGWAIIALPLWRRGAQPSVSVTTQTPTT
jgi:hypothetical protein